VAEEREKASSGLSLQTLLISATAAVVATVVVSQFWRQGTLFFTAMVPVVVAITSELLKRPAEKITAVAPKVVPRPVIRRTPGGTEVREPAPEPEPVVETRDDPFGLREPERRSWLQDRRVRLGLVTGLVAFVLGAAFITLSELTFGGSVGGGERRTTLLGGSKATATPDGDEGAAPSSGQDATPTATPDAANPEATPTTESGEETPTPTPSVTPSATPSATVAPEGGAQATPVP
jgi:hypothetical protein